MARLLGSFLVIAAALTVGYFSGIDIPQAQVGGWAHPARANNLGNSVTQIIPSVNANVSRGGALVLMACAATGNTATAYVQLFDTPTAANVTLGTTTPTLSFAIPGNTAMTWSLSASGVGFGTGLFGAATSTATGSTAAAATVDCNFGYL